MPVLTRARSAPDSPAAFGTGALFLGVIAVGSLLGLTLPDFGDRLSGATDTTLLVMIFLLFFEIRLGAFALSKLRFIALAWGANFLIVPLIGFAIASVLLHSQPLLFAGLMIYFLAPCTDWFLGFTRMAQGDSALGAALIPVNLISQLLLFPVWLWLFTSHSGLVDIAAIPGLLAQWFIVPLLAAQTLRFALDRVLPLAARDRLLHWTGQLVPLVLALLILQLFATHIGVIAGHADALALIALAVFLFFAATLFVGDTLARLFRLAYPERALLAMTMAARNAPMMIAITAATIPDQPLILVALIIGMLIEIPHLTALKHLLLHRKARAAA
ncbi:MAG: arsenic resistance protein [Pseudomonadota bacterium]